MIVTCFDEEYLVTEYVMKERHPLHDSPLWISRERGDEQRISKDQYLGLFSIVASRGIEYVNIYEVLNVVKK